MIEIPFDPFCGELTDSILERLPDANYIECCGLMKYGEQIARRYAYLILHPKYTVACPKKRRKQESPLKPSRKGQKRQRRVAK